MQSLIRLGLVLSLALLPVVRSAAAQEAGDAGRILWSKDLPTAMVQARSGKRILMVCINAKRVDGRTDEEPAAKGLREVVYKDPRVVKRSRDFVCVLLTAEGDSDEYDALRLLGIEGRIISPQHVFVNSAGDKILRRKQYWTHGSGDKAVEALLALMDEAEKAAEKHGDEPPPDAVEPAPSEGDARTAWIAGMLKQLDGPLGERDAALKALIAADKEGDCTDPLIALLPENEKNVDLLWALIRALGRDGLEKAAIPISEFLKHKDDSIRGNAAVSLEYIGSSDKKVIAALRKLAEKDKEESIANHAYRALGRCGVEEGKIRSLLLKKAGQGKSEFATYGPCIGLAYFEGDEKAMRGVEKLLKQIGVPGSRRGGGQNAVKRGLVSWTLASIGDDKSATFMREELIDGLKNVKAFWVGGLTDFWENTARACEGDDEALATVHAGVAIFVRFARGGNLERYGAESRDLMDECRTDREPQEFKPKGDNILGGEGDR